VAKTTRQRQRPFCPFWAERNDTLPGAGHDTAVVFTAKAHRLFRDGGEDKMQRRGWVVALTMTLLAGCASDEIVKARLDVTVGQQLIDLKNAHDAGALSRAEYDRQRAKLIESVR
jgi:hypothetical protein